MQLPSNRLLIIYQINTGQKIQIIISSTISIVPGIMLNSTVYTSIVPSIANIIPAIIKYPIITAIILLYLSILTYLTYLMALFTNITSSTGQNSETAMILP